jgi:hypothetical protein
VSRPETDQLSFDFLDDDMSPAEIEAIIAELVARHKSPRRPRPRVVCQCEGGGTQFFDADDLERRCLKCGRQPRSENGRAA